MVAYGVKLDYQTLLDLDHYWKLIKFASMSI